MTGTSRRLRKAPHRPPRGRPRGDAPDHRRGVSRHAHRRGRPAGHSQPAGARSAGRRSRIRLPGVGPGAWAQEQDRALVHRPRLLRHDHAAGDSPQHHGEPRLVHALHAIPGRDRAGPSRVPPQFPDDGEGLDGDGGGGGLAARRADGGGRGDDAAAPRAAEASRRQGARHIPRLGAHLAADPRRPRVARGTARPDGQGRRSRGHPVRRVGVRRCSCNTRTSSDRSSHSRR